MSTVYSRPPVNSRVQRRQVFADNLLGEAVVDRLLGGFTSRYGVDRLVRFECCEDPVSAIAREKDIKKWRRDWKVRLIEEDDPDWRDCYDTVAR